LIFLRDISISQLLFQDGSTVTSEVLENSAAYLPSHPTQYRIKFTDKTFGSFDMLCPNEKKS